MTELWWVYLPIGAVVGFLAGLLGIGGGMLLVPIMVFVFTWKAFPPEILMHLALATAMATIPFTSAASVGAHHARGNVEWPIVRGMLPGLVVGAAAGALTAGLVPSRPLAVFFTMFIFYAATNMFFDVKPKAGRRLPGPAGLAAVATAIAWLASFLAAGAAFMTVPFMTWCNVALKRAMGTAAAIGFPLSVASSIGWIWAGWNHPQLPAGSAGFVYLPALVMVVAASVFTAPLGARVAVRMPVKQLRVVFAISLYFVAGRMLYTLWTS